MKEFKRITFDSCVMGGQACIRGMRIPVSLIVNLVANGMATKEIIGNIPILNQKTLKNPYNMPPG